MTRCIAASMWFAFYGCQTPPASPQGHLCSVTNRTALSEASNWTGPSEQEVLDTIATHPPLQVSWDELTLDTTSSPLSVTVAWDSGALEVVERDCPHDPLLLEVPITLNLNLGEGGVTGELEGELKATPEGQLTVRAEGVADSVEPWTGKGATYVDEQEVNGDLVDWRATVKGPWSEAVVRLDAVNIDAEGRDWVTVLWHGHWVSEAAQP
jgi:hypothetical protein